MPKPLMIEDLPYPDVSALKPDARTARILSPAYASSNSELTACLQYIYHHFHFTGEQKKYSELLENVAIAEMHHLNLLGAALNKLGADPVYAYPLNGNRFYSACEVNFVHRPQAMLLADISAETEAIAGYEAMLPQLRNETVCALVSRILLDEKLHLSHFKQAYAELTKGG